MQQISKNIVKSALLFGGTLGVATAAEAGLTVTSAYFNLNAGGVYASNFDASAIGSPFAAIGANSSLAFSGLGQYGFLVSAASDGNEIWSVYGATMGFTTDANMTVQLTGDISSEAATVFLVDTNTNSTIFLRASGTGMWDSGLFSSRPRQLPGGREWPLTFPTRHRDRSVLAFSFCRAGALRCGSGWLIARRRPPDGCAADRACRVVPCPAATGGCRFCDAPNLSCRREAVVRSRHQRHPAAGKGSPMAPPRGWCAQSCLSPERAMLAAYPVR